MVLGLIAAAMSLASLPLLSRHFNHGDEAAFGTTLARVLGMVTVLILPATAGLAVLAGPVATLLFGHGATDSVGVHAITIALLGYLPGTLAAAYDQVLMFAFYARQETRIPVLVGVVAVAAYLVVAFSLVDRYGMMGLVAANSTMFIVRALAMWWAIRRIDVRVGDGALAQTFRGAAAGTLALVAVALVSLLVLSRGLGLETDLDASLLSHLVQVGIPAAAGAVAYVLVLHRVGTRELDDLHAALLRRLGR
jgi:putative peptidoglycan lipid II flippase